MKFPLPLRITQYIYTSETNIIISASDLNYSSQAQFDGCDESVVVVLAFVDARQVTALPCKGTRLKGTGFPVLLLIAISTRNLLFNSLITLQSTVTNSSVRVLRFKWRIMAVLLKSISDCVRTVGKYAAIIGFVGFKICFPVPQEVTTNAIYSHNIQFISILDVAIMGWQNDY